MTTLIADCETNGFLKECDKFWLLQLGDAETDEVTIYSPETRYWHRERSEWLPLPDTVRPIEEGLQRLREADEVVFHNGIKFDFWAINKFYPNALARSQIVDTLVMARLADPEERDHRLEAWGHRTGVFKGTYKGDFSRLDDELLVYAPQDIVAGRALYDRVKQVREWGESCQLEHDVAWIINAQELNGFTLDVQRAEALAADLRGEIDELHRQLQEAFPPVERTETFIPKVNNSSRGYVKDQPFTKRKMETFNPGSRQQIAERLMALGWVPKSKTPSGEVMVDETILLGLKYPEAKLLAKTFKVTKMLGQLSDGKAGWLRLVTANGRVHGRVNPNGACTGRMTHSKPNMAQVDKDHRMRSLWVSMFGLVLVGCDAEGLEARMLAHYLFRWDKGAFGNAVVNGDKKAGTDVHTLNLKALQPLGLASRDGAKTILYALMYGAGDYKLGESLKDDARAAGGNSMVPKVPSKELGLRVRQALAKSMLGSDKLTDATKARAKSPGYVRGIDGRHIKIRSEHSALNTLLQGGGAIVMKKALALFVEEFGQPAPYGNRYAFCANVHDEVQMECAPEDADELGKGFADAIRRAGEHFKMNCALAGAYAVGPNWAETH